MKYHCISCNIDFNNNSCSVRCPNGHSSNILTSDAYNKLKTKACSSNMDTLCFICTNRRSTKVTTKGIEYTFNNCGVTNENIDNLNICPIGLWRKD